MVLFCEDVIIEGSWGRSLHEFLMWSSRDNICLVAAGLFVPFALLL
jgi:hypothetical protein